MRGKIFELKQKCFESPNYAIYLSKQEINLGIMFLSDSVVIGSSKVYENSIRFESNDLCKVGDYIIEWS